MDSSQQDDKLDIWKQVYYGQRLSGGRKRQRLSLLAARAELIADWLLEQTTV